VAKNTGLAAGKAEVYEQRFSEAMSVAYDRALPTEKTRIEREALDLLNSHFSSNGVVALAEAAVLKSADRFGVAPGNTIAVDLLLRNAGQQASVDGAIKVKVIETSNNVSVERVIAPINSIPARAVGHTSALFGMKILDNAQPGGKIRLLAEITYPGNDFQAVRTERIEVQETIGMNPAVTTNLDFSANPDVDGFLGRINVHSVTASLTAKYAGVNRGHEVRMEEVGSSYATFEVGQATAAVRQGQPVNAVLKYKLKKNAKGKSIKFKVTVKFGNEVLEEREIVVKAK
jgi:hypothetical protein